MTVFVYRVRIFIRVLARSSDLAMRCRTSVPPVGHLAVMRTKKVASHAEVSLALRQRQAARWISLVRIPSPIVTREQHRSRVQTSFRLSVSLIINLPLL